MPVESIETNVVLSAAKSITEDSRIKVTYNSSRSDEVQTMEGKITAVVVKRGGEAKITFRRRDGQICYLKDDEWLYSKNSHAPRTGHVIEIEVSG